jgi:predicted RNase H-like nuclease (RuvC/YqgF family)
MKELSSNTEVSFENTIKNTLKDKYVQFGLTKEDVQKMTVIELLEKIAERLQHSDKEFNYYASVVNNLEQKVDKLVIENKEMKQRMIDMKAENKSLNVELAKVREENYKLKLENSLYQQRTITQENTKSLSIAK